MIAWRMLWKDWEFAPELFKQAERFLDLARNECIGSSQEGFIRASIVFYLMSFEAFFFALVKGYIQQRRTTLSPSAVLKVERKKNPRISEVIEAWPELLTGMPLDYGTREYRCWKRLTYYRNALVHGKISEHIEGDEKSPGSQVWTPPIAQEFETLESVELARRAVSGMMEMTVSCFGIPSPTWIPTPSQG